MDRSWIKSRMFSREHVEGVKEFMTFVSERFNDDEDMLCPCRRCLNRVCKPKGQVEDHLYIHGMAATYTTWVHHGEPLEVVPHEIDHHVDEHTSFNPFGKMSSSYSMWPVFLITYNFAPWECVEHYKRFVSLKEIIELRYNADSGGHRTVVLFRCDWFDTHGKKFRMKEDGFFTSINHGSLWYKDDPFILAAQATKIFYLLDTKYRENWRVVQKFSHRHLWSVAENDIDSIADGVVLSYQDDDCEGVHVRVDASVLGNEQSISEAGVRVDACVVDELRLQREVEGEHDDSSDSEDETGWQYVSDNEGPTIPPEDDDDSDYE